MPATIAVIADTHLPEPANSAQDAALDWALAALAERRPDVVIVAGDVTAAGSAPAARRFRQKMDGAGVKFLITPGNSDRRGPTERAQVRQALTTETTHEGDGYVALLADTSEGRLAESERRRLETWAGRVGGRRLVVITHCPPETMEAGSRQWFEGWVKRSRASLVVAAHRHREHRCRIAQAKAYTIRGLDPDKAIGEPPAVALFEWRDGVWRKSDLVFGEGTAEGWSAGEREEFLSLLGISCMEDPIGGLELAIEESVPCVELRANAADVPEGTLRDGLARWREGGGRHLSWHMPDLTWDEAEGRVADDRQWERSLTAALSVGAQALTIHVPRAPVRLMRPGSRAWRGLSDALGRIAMPAAGEGLTIGIENMHMMADEAPDDTRRFGYLPDECLGWIEELRARLGEGNVGLLLDVAHARNNAPFSEQLTLGAWYALTGPEAVGYHLHQVAQTAKGMTNHHPIRGLFGPLISYSSFLWAWRAGQLSHAAMFLEIRDASVRCESLQAMRGAIALTAAMRRC